MTIEQELNRHFADTGILAAGCTREDWYPGHFVHLGVGSWKLPIFPILRRGGPIVIHDVHHMLTGAAPDWRGEVELAGWELASGGCRWHVFYWFDRLVLALLGLVSAPRALLRGLRAGRTCRNLYGADTEELLAADADDVRGRLDRLPA